MADDASALAQLSDGGPLGLTRGEQVLLAGLRLWAGLRLAGEAPQASVRQLMAEQVSDRAGAIFVAMMESLERQTRRPLEIRCGPCVGYAQDEQRLIVACGVSRVDMSTARALLTPLVIQPEPVAIFARALNMVLSHEGLEMPARLFDAPFPPGPGGRSSVTLH